MSKSATLSIKLSPAERKDLRDLSRFKGTEPTALGAQFISEGLRTARFPGIEFRNTPLGRMAYLKNSRLAVWLTYEWHSSSYNPVVTYVRGERMLSDHHHR